MARIKYLGPVDPMRIPEVGPVGKDWIFCPDFIAREFEHVENFQVEFDKSPPLQGEGKGGDGPSVRTRKATRGGDK